MSFDVAAAGRDRVPDLVGLNSASAQRPALPRPLQKFERLAVGLFDGFLGVQPFFEKRRQLGEGLAVEMEKKLRG